MKTKYGVQKWEKYLEYEQIVWYDTLEEAIKDANGEPIIKSVAYEVEEKTDE